MRAKCNLTAGSGGALLSTRALLHNGITLSQLIKYVLRRGKETGLSQLSQGPRVFWCCLAYHERFPPAAGSARSPSGTLWPPRAWHEPSTSPAPGHSSSGAQLTLGLRTSPCPCPAFGGISYPQGLWVGGEYGLLVSYQDSGDNERSVAERVRDVGPSSLGNFCDVQTVGRVPRANLKRSERVHEHLAYGP